MITKRIIPCLDVKDGRVVKGVNFLGLADVSSPVKLAEYYSGCGADDKGPKGSLLGRASQPVYRHKDRRCQGIYRGARI